MKVIYKNLPSKKKEFVATIGVFDGIHHGHQHILNQVKREARKRGISSLVITFDIPPQVVLAKYFPGYILSLTDKENILKSLGINYLWLLKTHVALLQLSGKEFLNYIFHYAHIRKFIVGDDFRLGYKGGADIRVLAKLAKEYSFELEVIKKKQMAKTIVSSSLIRELIGKGQFERAEVLLGRKYYIEGQVVRGRGFGKILGFPTANIEHFGYVLPAQGVYSAYVRVEGKMHRAAVNIGVQPTMHKSNKTVIEAYIINFHKNILGREVRLFFNEKIRDEKKFASVEKLQEQITKDIAVISQRKKYAG